jgi:hypothetical protein
MTTSAWLGVVVGADTGAAARAVAGADCSPADELFALLVLVIVAGGRCTLACSRARRRCCIYAGHSAVVSASLPEGASMVVCICSGQNKRVLRCVWVVGSTHPGVGVTVDTTGT